MNPRTILLWCILSVIVIASASRPARADDPSPEQRAEALEAQAREAARAGNLEEAAATLRAAWDLAPWSSIACNLGRVEFARRRFRDAAEFLALCVESAPPVRTPEEKKRFISVMEQLAEARAKVVSLLLNVNEPQATVLVDGQRTATPPLPRVLFAEPGYHRVSATLDGFSPASADVQGAAGETIDVTLTLRAAPAPPKPAQAAPSVSSAPPPRPILPAINAPRPPPLLPTASPPSRLLAPSILGTAAAVSLAVGATYWIVADRAHNTMQRESEAFQEQRRRCNYEGCGAPEAFDAYTTARDVAVTALVLGGVLGAAACVTGLRPQASTKPASARALTTVLAW
ncbi:MAG TPA: hypothetical protein VE093_09645 [Polyangiaceae bacterium]|nr:hypothetical protein [Polyangiaceae bacterium]